MERRKLTEFQHHQNAGDAGGRAPMRLERMLTFHVLQPRFNLAQAPVEYRSTASRPGAIAWASTVD